MGEFEVSVSIRQEQTLHLLRRRFVITADVTEGSLPEGAVLKYELFRIPESASTERVKEAEGTLGADGDVRKATQAFSWPGAIYRARVALVLGGTSTEDDAKCWESDSVQTKDTRGMRVLLALLVGILVVLLLFVSVLAVDTAVGEHYLAAASGSAALLVVWVSILSYSGQLRRATLIGQDNRVSTSKTAVLVWTTVIGYVLAYFVILNLLPIGNECGQDLQQECSLLTLLGNNPDGADAGQPLPTEYLLLLGGPFASLIAAKAIVAAKVESGAEQRTVATDPTPGQAITDDDGKNDLVDSQYLLFNLIALVYFISAFVADPLGGLPAMPLTLVALTSAGAATYVGNKIAESSRLAITAVTPDQPIAGEEFQILGRNFLPAGAQSVTLELDGRPVKVSAVEKTAIFATLPRGIKLDPLRIKVTTEAGVTAETTVSALEHAPLTVTPATARPGQEVTLSAQGASIEQGQTVRVDGFEARVTTEGKIRIPLQVATGSAKTIEVLEGGYVSAQGTMTVEAAVLTLSPNEFVAGAALLVTTPAEAWDKPEGELKLKIADQQVALQGTGQYRTAEGPSIPSLDQHAVPVKVSVQLHDDEVVYAECTATILPSPQVDDVSPPTAKSGDKVVVSGRGLKAIINNETHWVGVAVGTSGKAEISAESTSTRVIATIGQGVPQVGPVAVAAPVSGERIYPSN